MELVNGSEPPKTFGVFGGTFDPPHIGHVTVARDLVRSGALDAVVWVPARQPPHKSRSDMAPPSLRLEMVKATTAGLEGQGWSDLELARDGPSYTVDTLRTLRAEYPDSKPVLIVGADQFAAFSTWREPEEVARLARLWVLTRDGQDPRSFDPGVAVEWTPAHVSRVDVSSSDVRRRVREGQPFRHLVPKSVAEVIDRENLYR